VFDGEVSLDRNGGFASVRSSAADRGLPGAQACEIDVRGDTPTTACRARQLPLDHPKLQRMKRMNAPTPQKDLGRSQPETDLPGGRDLNHAASVATSAALGAAAAGALAGSIAGPIGTAVGAAAGAVAAGIAGNQIANEIDAKAEEAHWRDNFRKQPYVDQDAAFDDYGPAYGYGVLAVIQYPGHPFEAVEAQLSDRWENARGTSTLDWDRARPASRDAWERASRRGPR
jgi:hypothetical protein